MPKFWLYQYIDGSWDATPYADAIPNLHYVVDGPIDVVEADTREDALLLPHTWDEDAGMNKDASVILSTLQRRIEICA